MTKYRYVIAREKEGYLFILYPNNSTNQEIGRSPYYKDKELCYKTLEEFKLFVKINKINDYNNKNVIIEKKDSGWHYKYINENKIIFFRKNGYEVKENAKKIINSIYKNIDAELIKN